jgi:glycosyltransferase involved in cell wall biosynthesis
MMKQNTICFFNTTFQWGGGEKWHFDMASHLAERGYSVVIVTAPNSALHLKTAETNIPCKTVAVTNLSFLNPVKKHSLKRLFRQLQVKTIIMNLPADMKVAGPAAKKAGVKKIIYRRGTALPVHNNLLNRYLFKHIITDVLVNSHATSDMLLSRNENLIDRSRIHVIYNGIDVEEIDKRDYEILYHRKEGELILGNASRFVHQKGHRYLIDIAARLKEKGVKFKLLLAGTGELKEKIQLLAKEKDVEDLIVFLGFVANIKSFMKTLDVFLLSSGWEGFGYVMTEAMACEKPVIAFDISSNPEIIKDKQTGYLVPFEDTQAFAEKIEMLSTNRNRIQTMGKAGREDTLERFDINRTVKQVENLVE